jgi:hypothetical protein
MKNISNTFSYENSTQLYQWNWENSSSQLLRSKTSDELTIIQLIDNNNNHIRQSRQNHLLPDNNDVSFLVKFWVVFGMIYLSSDHFGLYPQNQASDRMAKKLSAIYRRDRNEGKQDR